MNYTKSEHRFPVRFSLRTLLVAIAAFALVFFVLLWRAESRRQCFDDIRNLGAIVDYSRSHWGAIFDEPLSVTFYVNVEGEKIRIGDTLYSRDDAKNFLIEQKAIAIQTGLDEVSIRVMTSVDIEASDDLFNEMLNFGNDHFDNTDSWFREMYEVDWEANRSLHQKQ